MWGALTHVTLQFCLLLSACVPVGIQLWALTNGAKNFTVVHRRSIPMKTGLLLPEPYPCPAIGFLQLSPFRFPKQPLAAHAPTGTKARELLPLGDCSGTAWALSRCRAGSAPARFS